MKEETEWSAKTENKLKASMEDAKFIYDQAEKKLKEVVMAGDLVVARTTTLITLIVGLLVGLISFSINRYETICRFNDDFIISSTITIIYLLSILWYTSYNIHGTEYSVVGASPKTLFSENFFNDSIDKELLSKMLIWTQIENYQKSIVNNKAKNIERWKRFDNSLKLLKYVPVLLAALYIIGYVWPLDWFRI